MIIACLDTEHSTGAYRLWEKDFYLTCCGIIVQQGEERSEDLVWFDHSTVQPTPDGVVRIQEVVDRADLLVFHNAKHDISVLRGFGVSFDNSKIHCTMVGDYLIEGQNKQLAYSLNEVAKRYEFEGKDDRVKTYWDQGVDTYDIPDKILQEYCLQDCHLTLDIYLKQIPRIEKAGLGKVVDLQNEFTFVLADMEDNGLVFDTAVAHEIIQREQAEVERLRREILKDVPHGDKINLSSPQQLSALLYGGIMKLAWQEWVIVEYKTKCYSRYYEKTFRDQVPFDGLGFKPDLRTKKEDGYYKVDKDTIQGLVAHTREHRNIKKLLVEYSKHAKIVSTLEGVKGDKGLLSKLQPDGCLHPNLNQTITSTGRLSSSDPNGQNLFPAVKKCLKPRNDGIMQVDLSQIEWRDAAWLSQDQTMIAEVNGGVDQHIATATQMMKLKFVNKEDPVSKKNRNHAKVFNFRMIYGGTEWGFYLDIDMPSFSLKKWKNIIQDFFTKYSGLKDFHDKSVKFVYRHGYFKLPTGRWFKFNKVPLKDGGYGYKINQIKNFPVQGMSGGDILPLMAVIIRRGMRKMGLHSKLILTVHDSILFDYLEEEREKLARLCYRVGNNLDQYIKSYYGLDWNIKLECEVEAGNHYGDLKYISPEDVGL